MNCRKVTEFLADYLDGNLTWGQRFLFRLHLLLCPPCRNYLDSYRKTIAAAREALTEAKPSEDCPEALVRAILATRGQDSGAKQDSVDQE